MGNNAAPWLLYAESVAGQLLPGRSDTQSSYSIVLDPLTIRRSLRDFANLSRTCFHVFEQMEEFIDIRISGLVSYDAK